MGKEEDCNRTRKGKKEERKKYKREEREERDRERETSPGFVHTKSVHEPGSARISAEK